MTKHLKSAFQSPTHLSSALTGALITVLVLVAAGVSAQTGDDVSSNGAAPVATDMPQSGGPACAGHKFLDCATVCDNGTCQKQRCG